ncbi:MAG: hypothetical protein JEY99_12795 [Spirochaetales bacterium]|nr:hypothetical protein [Spirochaetales bacterium]
MKKPGIILIILLILTSGLSALTFDRVEARMGMVYYGYSGENRETSSPLKEFLGVGLPMDFGSRFEFRPELTLFYFDYFYNDLDGRALPSPIEKADRISVFHFLVNPAFSIVFPYDNGLSWGLSLSPSFLLRLPLIAVDEGDDDRSDITSYFYSAGRFFYPSAGGFFRWQFAERTALSITAWGHFPLFHLWDGSVEPFYDQLLVSVNAGFIFKF